MSEQELEAIEQAAYRMAGETLIDGVAASADLLALVAEVRALRTTLRQWEIRYGRSQGTLNADSENQRR